MRPEPGAVIFDLDDTLYPFRRFRLSGFAAAADALEAELEPLVGGNVIVKLHKYDTNPANNPQPPRRGAA